jgi:chromosome segregation protein
VYLKRLELNGFKTFADSTTLEFGPGVAGIVGPNGSGKSNLADAILWCLGEQSMKSLRSSRAHDVIFAGSESRRRAGVGEVSLTLDNSDQALPLDFTEITITRRVFRTGEGEYLINRVPCRLRDVHELLLDTGIGKHAYSMISQTEIDRILSVRSEDRREIFEQAAGVQRYRQRKNEAGRKLDRVYANLTRVNDIIHELEAQVEPLSQQSETAREYKELSKELFDLKLSLMVHQRVALKENLERAREREVELEREMEAARTRSHKLAAEEVELRARMQELEVRIEETRTLVGRLTSEADRADGRLNLTTQRIEDLKVQSAQAEEDLKGLEAQKRAAAEELAASELERPALAARAQELRAEIEAREQRLRQETGALRQTGESAEERRSGHLDTLRELADARNRLGQCESLLEAARARIGRLREQREAVRRQREELAAQAEEAARRVSEMRAQRERIAGELAALHLEEESGEGAAAELAAQELKLRERLSGVKSRQHALEEMERAREGLRAGVRAVLAAVDSGRLSGEYRTVAEMVRVPKELEAAIEAALGPAAGDLVVPTDREASDAIAYLKETRGGRATFLPRSRVRVSPRPERLAALAQSPGCLGVAADLVKRERGGEEVVEQLLGRVLVTETLESALALARNVGGWRALVTQDGDVVRPWGAITGGSRSTRVGLLGRGREISELAAEASDLEAELERIAGGLRQARERARSAAEKADVHRTELDRAADGLAEAERRAEVVGENVRLDVEREESLLGEEQALEEESRQIDQEREEAARRVEEQERRKHAAEAAMAEVESALSDGRDAREELSRTTSEMRVKLTEVEGDLRALEARLEKVSQSLRVLDGAMADKRSLMDRLAASQHEAEASLGGMNEECERLWDAQRKAEEELARTQEQRRELLESLGTNREGAAETRAEIEALQNREHRLELRLTQIESEIGFCERTLAEEYRISIEEAERKAGPIESRTAAQQRVKELQVAVEALGEVNVGSIEEYERVKQRLEFLGGQRADLEGAREDIQQAIVEIDREATSRFLAGFEQVKKEFERFFIRLFGGGSAELTLTDKENVLECGIDVTVTVPGKKTRDLLQLSGGERALTAAAILFALLKVKPSPFVILDEVDAPLDDSNIGRYCDVLREFAQQSQFIVITHNKGTMEAADVLYGVTLEEAGVSKLIGMRLRDEQERPREQPAVVEVPEHAEEAVAKAEDETADGKAGEDEGARAEEAA